MRGGELAPVRAPPRARPSSPACSASPPPASPVALADPRPRWSATSASPRSGLPPRGTAASKDPCPWPRRSRCDCCPCTRGPRDPAWPARGRRFTGAAVQRQEHHVDLGRIDGSGGVGQRAAAQVRHALVGGRRGRTRLASSLRSAGPSSRPAAVSTATTSWPSVRSDRDHLRGARDRDVTLLTRTTEQHRDLFMTQKLSCVRAREVNCVAKRTGQPAIASSTPLQAFEHAMRPPVQRLPPRHSSRDIMPVVTPKAVAAPRAAP